MKYIFIFFFSISASLWLQAQEVYDANRHNTSYNAGWISCFEAPNPNTDRGTGHWIMYDLNATYPLGQMHLWNLNSPSYLDDGIQEMVVDVSDDGVTWTEVSTFSLSQSTASGYYKGEEGPDLGGHEGQYILITALSNYGGDCFGLSEMRVEVQEASLPVTLVDFRGMCIDGMAAIEWLVENEVNSEGYIVELSHDLVEWEPLKIIPSRNTLGRNAYKFVDEQERIATGHFRVRQVDFDGNEEVFPSISIDCQDDKNGFEVFPTLAKDQLNLRYKSIADGNLFFEIVDMAGKRVKLWNVSGVRDTYYGQSDIEELPAGSYLIRVRDGNFSAENKFTKI